MKDALRKAKWAFAIPLISFAYVNVALAQCQNGNCNQSVTLTNPLGGQTFSQVVSNVIGFIFWDIATPLVVIMVLVGAFQLMTSAGNPEKASQGRKTIMYAAIGFGIALIASGISSLIQSILNNS
ncbi:MAG TPA: pilin [Candidatus Paceibacterota bacterium]|nr:pilin [Candidatus Paceibacterota bacterium]